jgi:hypothetical protein
MRSGDWGLAPSPVGTSRRDVRAWNKPDASARRPCLALPRYALLFTAAAWHPYSLQACTACFGQSDSPMAKGMNWGIMSLLVMIVGVLGCLVAFFVFLARRAATVSISAAAPAVARTTVPGTHDLHRLHGELGLAGTLPFRKRTEPLLAPTRSRL